MFIIVAAKNMVNSTEELVKDGTDATANTPTEQTENIPFPKGGICLLICEAFEQFAYYGTRSESSIKMSILNICFCAEYLIVQSFSRSCHVSHHSADLQQR